MNAQSILSTASIVELRGIELSLQRIIDVIRCIVAQKKMEEISTLLKPELLTSKLWPTFSPKFNALFAKIY